MRAAHYAISHPLQPPEPRELTLLDLVQSVCNESSGDDREIVAIVCDLLRTGRVRLCGNFRDAEAEILCGADRLASANDDRSDQRTG